MNEAINNTSFDIVIIGAGPAGCSLALSLKDSGLKVGLFDKSTFPRDKICGDAIPGRAIKVLRSINPDYEVAFKNYPKKYATQKTKIFFEGKELIFSWVLEAYTCKRIDFDSFLLNLVKKHTSTIINEGVQMVDIQKHIDYITFTTNTGINFTTKVLIGADGAQSLTAKKLASKVINRNHYVASVRAYYSGMVHLEPNTTYIFLHKAFLPSYLWIFPLPDGKANIGVGMQSATLIKRKINLKKMFQDIISQTPNIEKLMEHGKPIGSLSGFGLPLGSLIENISGSRYLLIGDGASLIDPASGDGIGNAMLSGKLAADTLKKCFAVNNFSADYMLNYDKLIKKHLGKELKTHYYLQLVLSKFPFILSIAFGVLNNNFFIKYIKKIF